MAGGPGMLQKGISQMQMRYDSCGHILPREGGYSRKLDLRHR